MLMYGFFLLLVSLTLGKVFKREFILSPLQFGVPYSRPRSNEDLDPSILGADDSDDNNRSSSEYQTCIVSNFYISDMIVASLPIEGNSPSTFFDVAKEYMILPFLEDTMEAGGDHDGRTCEDTIIDADDLSLYLAIHQLRSCNEEPDVNPYLDSDQSECFDPHMFIRNLPDLPDVVPNFHPTTLLNETQKMQSTTLVLDLDGWPYLQMFLERVAEMFEIVVFTASQSIYAEQLLDIMDPDRKLISRRAYRESCIFSDGSYTKNLTVLGVDLAKIAIIDKSLWADFLPIDFHVSFVKNI
ncbi:unnamed protein product [Camellia sinensis]